MTPEDPQLRALFAQVRNSDETAAPSFDHTWSAATQLQTRSILSQLRFGRIGTAVAAMVAVAVTIGLLWHQPANKPLIVRQSTTAPATSAIDPAADSIATLSNWQSPTAFLLRSTDEWDQSADPSDVAVPTTQPRQRT